MTSEQFIYTFFTLHICWWVLFTFVIANQRRNPTSAGVWIFIVLTIPIFGTLFYIIGGYRPNRPSVSRSSIGESPVERVVNCNCGTSMRPFNRVELLHNGDNALVSLIGSLEMAERSIHMEYYIFIDDLVGRAISDILMDKARAGIEVRVIYDTIGSWSFRNSYIKRMREAGVEVIAYGAIKFPWITTKLNCRNHRKIVVIDGKVGYVGGINIAKRYVYGDFLGRWRDEHIRVEGDVVADLQRIFIADWNSISGKLIDCTQYIESHSIKERTPMQIAWAEEGVSSRTILEAFAVAIIGAKREVRISSPYFMPPPLIMNAIKIAVRSGVRVVVMTPSKSDMPVVDFIADSYIMDFLDSGVELFRYKAGFLHAKVLVVDDNVASVGTANMDYRSLYDNMEVTAFIYDKEIIKSIITTFDEDLESAQQIETSILETTPLWKRRLSDILRLLSPIM